MNVSFRTFVATAFLIGAVQFADVRSAPLSYKFVAGQTNAYRVQLSSKSETNPRRYEGVILIRVQEAEGGQANISFGGTLKPMPVEGQGGRPPGMMPFGGPFGPVGLFGPGMRGAPYVPLWPNMPMNMPNENLVDSHGRILRYASMLDLPKPLESYANIFFHELPGGTTNSLETERVIEVDDDLSANTRNGPRGRFGRFGPFGPNGSQDSRLTGTRREKTRILERTAGEVRLEAAVDFSTWAKTGDDPRLSFSTRAELVFLPKEGVLKSGRIEGTATHSTLDFTTKSPVVLAFDRLEGDELAQALVSGGFTKPEVPTEKDFDHLIAQLKSSDSEKRIEAAAQLSSVDLEKNAAALLPRIRPWIGANEPELRNMAAQVLSAGATVEDVPLILKLLHGGDNVDEISYIQALARLTDNRAIEPLADIIARGYNQSYQAADALAKFGAAAEPVALSLLKEKNIETKRHACRILQEVGTPKSAEALQAVIKDGDPNIIPDAAQALQSIRQRGEDAAKMVF